MIISVSRRTDIPAYYSEWFFNRLKTGFVYVRNPMNPRRISEILLSPDVVDGIVFWTKNPFPMLNHLDELSQFPYYFQFTLTPYGLDIEKNLPSKKEVLVPSFHRLSSLIGKKCVIWRYDPILLNEKYTLAYHIKCFNLLCDKLAGYTEKCIISFLDLYRNIQSRIAPLGIYSPSPNQAEELASSFAAIAKNHGISIATCSESMDLSKYGIGHASCIDRQQLEHIGNYKLSISRDPNQRPACGCVSSIDIGAYNSCLNGCIYCYANYNASLVHDHFQQHDPMSPLLFGKVSDNDVIIRREMKSLCNGQINFFHNC